MNYSKGIYLFNLALPALLCLALFSLIGKVKSNLNLKFEKREIAYNKSKMLDQKIVSLKEETSDYTENYSSSWNELLTAEASVQITQTLNNILKEIRSRDLQQTSFKVNAQSDKFSTNTQQDSSSVNLRFRGRYAIMQSVLVELETRLPHFFLESLSVSPSQTDDDTLDFFINYVVWKK